MTALESTFLVSVRARMGALFFGPEDGRPVLALHGWLDNAASFARLAPLLSGCRVVAVDLPGHGLSSHRDASADYHYCDWFGDVVAALDALAWDQCVLLGHSMGATIATAVAGIFPERVQGVVAIEGIGPLTAAAAEFPQRLRRHIEARQRLDGKTKPAYPSKAAALEARHGAGDFASSDVIEPVVDRGLVQGEDGLYRWRTDARLTLGAPIRLTPEQALACLGSVECPVLHVRAAPGLAVDVSLQETYGRLLEQRPGGFESVTIAGGHHVHLEDPAEVAAVAQRFLRRCLAGGQRR